MKVELINTGTELLLGDVVNTNAAWLGRRLTELGLRVDAQNYERDSDHTQISPRVNFRYDLQDDLRLMIEELRPPDPWVASHRFLGRDDERGAAVDGEVDAGVAVVVGAFAVEWFDLLHNRRSV